MSNRFEWTEKMGEISGFGGDYEAACRSMVEAGVKWLEDSGEVTDPDRVDHFRALGDHIAEPFDGATGAMVGASANHAMLIHEKGWDAYVAKLEARPPSEPMPPRVCADCGEDGTYLCDPCFRKRFFKTTMKALDRCFQDDDCLLPDFIRCGEDKTDGIVRMAEEIVRLRGMVNA